MLHNNNSRNRGRNFNRNYSSDRIDQENEDYLPEGIIIIITIDKTRTLDSDQDPGVDPTQE